MENNQTILGLSPGTRTFGYAVFRYEELVDFGIKSFKGKWSENKLLHITASLSQVIEQYRPDVIVLKISGTGTRTRSMRQLHARIGTLLRQRRIKVNYCTLEDMKRNCIIGVSSNIKELHSCLMEEFPILSFVSNKGLNRHIYYSKMFEALGAIKFYLSEI